MTITEKKIADYISRSHLLKAGQRVLIALSGGADSVCLLRSLLALGYDCVAAHCNFHLRGDESDRDELFVTNLCHALDVQLFKTGFDTVSYSQQHGISIEMAARELRYDYFQRLLTANALSTLAVGHHQDDQVETVLLNMVRGTGIRGASGIMPRREMNGFEVVRPLLAISHAEVKDYLREIGQNWVEDSTNQHDDVGRNVIRLNVMPQLQRINPAAQSNIISTIDNLQEVERIYRHAIMRDIEDCLVGSGQLSIECLFRTISPKSVLHEWLADKGFNATHERDILSAALQGQSGKLFVADTGERILIDRTSIIIESEQHFIAPSDIIINEYARESVTIQKDPRFAYLDADKVRGSLMVRSVKPSDTFQPFGMKGRKLLSDFLTDKKLNLFQKQRQLVVCDEDDIAWVVGLRSSERYRVDKDTTRVVVLEVQL